MCVCFCVHRHQSADLCVLASLCTCTFIGVSTLACVWMYRCTVVFAHADLPKPMPFEEGLIAWRAASTAPAGSRVRLHSSAAGRLRDAGAGGVENGAAPARCASAHGACASGEVRLGRPVVPHSSRFA